MAYGVLAAGFSRKPLDVCVQELRDAIHATFGATQDCDDPSGPWAQLIGVLADRESELWDMGEAVYASRDPDQATGDALRGICSITGTVPQDPLFSQVALTLSGSPGTIVGAGFVASVTGSGIRFATTAAATIGGGGTIALVPAQAEESGPLIAPAGTLTTIETPVAGVTAVTNPLDAVPGRNVETDAELRLRRVAELAVAGSATPPAVQAEVENVAGVTSCTVFENTGDATDSDGVPPHAIEVVVTGGVDQDIINAIWNSRSSGIYPHGGVTGTVTDALGVVQTLRFSRPTSVPIYLVVNLKIDAAKYPADGDAQVKAALVAWGLANLSGGVAVVAWQLKRDLTISGITDCATLFIGLSAAPASEATILIGSRSIAAIDTSRITVNHA
jgi:uncharacterized phage protein gp47/JayE